MKRSRGGPSLTGGSGDVNPQWLKVTFDMTGADAATTEQILLPVPKIPQSGRSTIIEVLKVHWTPIRDTTSSAVEVVERFLGKLSTKSFGTAVISEAEGTLIDAIDVTDRGAFTAAGTYHSALSFPIVHDLTDGDGHGVLVATDSLFVQADTAGYSLTGSLTVWILYRFKNVGVMEYVGIVQSQQ